MKRGQGKPSMGESRDSCTGGRELRLERYVQAKLRRVLNVVLRNVDLTGRWEPWRIWGQGRAVIRLVLQKICK